MILNHGYSEDSRKLYTQAVNKLSKSTYLRKFGSTALELCDVAQGSVDGFLSSGDELWDYAAGTLLVQEAGGIVTNWQGDPFNPKNSAVFASNNHLYPRILPIIKSLI